MTEPGWTTRDAVDLYNVAKWGDGYFDVNAEGRQGNTALFWATLRGQLDVVREMLKLKKVDVHDTNLLAAIAHITHKRCGTLIGANKSLISSSSLASKALCCNFYC